MTLLRKCR